MTETSLLRLSIVIPVYDEIRTLPKLLAEVIKKKPEVPIEIVIVDDGSVDGTREWLCTLVDGELDCAVAMTLDEHGDVCPVRSGASPSDVIVHVHLAESNKGKGAAVRKGFELASYEVLVVQDADLEYDPADICRMWPLIAERGADVVYGSRFYGLPHRSLYLHHYAGNRLISILINLLCNATLSDVEVCYKMFRREVIEAMTLTSNDFGIEVEVTVKTLRAKRWNVYEIGICYYGRTYEEGKKINWRDGVKALWYILKFRFFSRMPKL